MAQRHEIPIVAGAGAVVNIKHTNDVLSSFEIYYEHPYWELYSYSCSWNEQCWEQCREKLNNFIQLQDETVRELTHEHTYEYK